MKSYKLLVPDEITTLLRNLHPNLKGNIRQALKTIINSPHCGKALKEELEGLRSFRVKKIRIIYRETLDKHIEIIAIGPRRTIYEETFRIISKVEKSKH